MTSFKNISDDDRELVVDGQTIVAPKGEIFDVPDELAVHLEQQPHFEQVGAKKTPAKKTSAKRGNVRQAAGSDEPIQSAIEGAVASEQGAE